MPTNKADAALYFLLGIVVLIFLLFLLVGFVMFLNDFAQELKYINNEIQRAEGAERKRWIRQKRRLWLSLIPFVRY